ncbi:MAG TPA: histidine phosphatase family protein [Steroidobacteraceae bacterium]|nr:histidine phosphatase family protein [Steroidobacteraceae bacterium]
MIKQSIVFARHAVAAWALLSCAIAGSAHAQSLSGSALVDALRHGGYVLVMRHASSPPVPPDKSSADPGNVSLERQLDETGRRTARSMGDAIKQLHIPVGSVFSSPAYRAQETVRLASLGTPKASVELNAPQGMAPANGHTSQATWLRKAVRQSPMAGSNTFLVTHAPNIMAAFPESAAGLADGETLIFRPDGRGSAFLVARVKIEEWPQLAAQKP